MLAALRVLRRLSVLLGGSAASLAHFGLLWLRHAGMPPLGVRARWLHAWCRWGVPKLGVDVRAAGTLPARGLMVANHQSYLDILVLSAQAPAVFVAKREVRSWPVFGLMARLAGAIFIERVRMRELPRVIAEVRSAFAAGVPVVLFPEATTTDGASVLPFRSGLFQSAVTSAAPVTPVAIAYASEGDPAREVCWWGEMDFLPHLINLLAKPKIVAQVDFCSAPHVWRNRKVAAIFTREQVVAMRAPAVELTAPAPQATLDATAAPVAG